MARFWAWYERNYALNITVALFLFLLQLIHLVWLSADVVAERLVGTSYFPVGGAWLAAVVFVDYLEIPALFSVSLVYIHEIRRDGMRFRPLLMLVLLNSQWLHILWITDEFVIRQFSDLPTAWPAWLAWVAIGIDYLELPVMWDTGKRFVKTVIARKPLEEVKEALDHD